jgi:hypothetical protein
MEKHCVSLEIAKQLKEGGFKKETKFWWIKTCYIDNNGNAERWILDIPKDIDKKREKILAPLATEILEELPDYRYRKDISYDSFLSIEKTHTKKKGLVHYEVNYRYIKNHLIATKNIDDSLPNALARMWLYLKKENLLCPKTV